VINKINIASLPEFDASHYLDSEVAIAEYLTAIIDDGDSALLAAALGDIARARGMSEIARSAGLTREALYKALRPNAHPRFDTISKVCKALGVKLNVEAI
jgi:probable addiction module antidote protein